MFWRLLWSLPFYQGAVAGMLRHIAAQRAVEATPEPAQAEPVNRYADQMTNILPQVHGLATGEKEVMVPPEALNLVTGENLISFGRGG